MDQYSSTSVHHRHYRRQQQQGQGGSELQWYVVEPRPDVLGQSSSEATAEAVSLVSVPENDPGVSAVDTGSGYAGGPAGSAVVGQAIKDEVCQDDDYAIAPQPSYQPPAPGFI